MDLVVSAFPMEVCLLRICEALSGLWFMVRFDDTLAEFVPE
jgi:hypothetical protein